MANTTKSSLENLVKAVLAVGNQDQNLFYPPHIIDQHINITTSLLIDRLSKTYPVNVDMLQPFIKSFKTPVKKGYVELQDDYRNLLGAPSINVRDDGSDCSDNPVIIDTEREFELEKLKSGCKSRPIDIVDKAQWDYRTTSNYDYPTYKNPIGMFVGVVQGMGTKKQMKVCPYDLKFVEVTYVRSEKKYRYGYTLNPDDTFIFDPLTSEDTEWGDAAFSKLFSAMLALYSAYSRDNMLSDWGQILINQGIL